MPRGSDDTLAKQALLKLITAVGYVRVPDEYLPEFNRLIQEAGEIARRIDTPRGRKAKEASE